MLYIKPFKCLSVCKTIYIYTYVCVYVCVGVCLESMPTQDFICTHTKVLIYHAYLTQEQNQKQYVKQASTNSILFAYRCLSIGHSISILKYLHISICLGTCTNVCTCAYICFKFSFQNLIELLHWNSIPHMQTYSYTQAQTRKFALCAYHYHLIIRDLLKKDITTVTQCLMSTFGICISFSNVIIRPRYLFWDWDI